MMFPNHLYVSVIYVSLQFLYHGVELWVSRAIIPPSWPTKGLGVCVTVFCEHMGTLLISLSTWVWRKYEPATRVSFLLNAHTVLVLAVWWLVSVPAHLLSKRSESLSHLWSMLATVFWRLFSISAAFTTALKYFRTMANCLIAYSQRKAKTRRCMLRGPFLTLYGVCQITVLSPCPWTE